MTTLEKIEQSADYWSLLLVRALRTSDLAEAAEAQAQLLSLGFDVRLRLPFLPPLDDDRDGDADG